jgi:O-antigen ligase
MAILAQLVLLYLYLLFGLYQRKSMKFLWASIFLPLIIIMIIIFTNNIISDYVINIIHFNNFSFENYNPRIVNSFNIRFGLWKCSYESLSENYNWIAGIGTGDSKQIINNCINSKMGSFFSGYDPHNQYLSYLINQGIIGLIFFLVTIIFPFINSIKKGRKLQFVFISAIAIFCLTEGLFNLQVGVVFFSLFYSLLVIKDYKRQTIIS